VTSDGAPDHADVDAARLVAAHRLAELKAGMSAALDL